MSFISEPHYENKTSERCSKGLARIPLTFRLRVSLDPTRGGVSAAAILSQPPRHVGLPCATQDIAYLAANHAARLVLCSKYMSADSILEVCILLTLFEEAGNLRKDELLWESRPFDAHPPPSLRPWASCVPRQPPISITDHNKSLIRPSLYFLLSVNYPELFVVRGEPPPSLIPHPLCHSSFSCLLEQLDLSH